MDDQTSGDQIRVEPPLKEFLAQPHALRGMSRAAVREYLYGSLAELGIDHEEIAHELDGLIDDPDYVAAQKAVDVYWEGVHERVASLRKKGISPMIDTSEGGFLDLRRDTYSRSVLHKLLTTWKTKVVDSSIDEFPIRVFALHCPDAPGAKCTYTETDKHSSLGAFTLRAFGSGGGGKMQAYLQLSTDFTASDGKCYCVTKKCTVRVEHCVEMYRGRARAEYARLSPVALELGYEKRPLEAADDACHRTWSGEEEPDAIRFDLARAPDPDEQTLIVGREKSSHYELGLSVASIGLGGTVRIEQSSFTEKRLKYELPGLRTYRALWVDKDFGYAWKIE
jgi:hypothetical protein